MKQHRRWLRRSIVTGLAVITVVFAGVGGASAGESGRGGPVGNHCITPWGEDLNEKFGTSAQIVAPLFDCAQVDVGERWTLPAPWWGMNTTFEATPKGFVPAGDTPLEDFLAKFAGARYVIDPGTAHERSYFYPAGESLWTSGSDRSDEVTVVDELNSLPVGNHVVEVYWVFNGTHCDGWAKKIEQCLTGENLHTVEEFEVTPRDQ